MKELSWNDWRVWALSTIVFVALICVGLESFDFISSALLGVFALGGLVGGLAAIVFGIKKGRKTWVVVGAHVLVVPILSAIISGRLARRQFDKSILRGDGIVAALEAHHSAAGRYPNTLGELVPKHLAEVPLTEMGLVRRIPFGYNQTENDGYTLSFSGTAWTVCHRNKNTGWACDD